VAQPVQVTRKGDQIHVIVPEHAIGALIGRKGQCIKELERETNCKIHVDAIGKNTRLLRIRSQAVKHAERESAVEYCSRVVQYMCEHSETRLKMVLAQVHAEIKALDQEKDQAKIQAQQNQAAQQLSMLVGDLFNEAAIREALFEETWDLDRAQDRLFQPDQDAPAEYAVRSSASYSYIFPFEVPHAEAQDRPIPHMHDPAACVVQTPTIDARMLLEACRARKFPERPQKAETFDGAFDDDQVEDASTAASESETNKVSPGVQAIRDVFAEARRKGIELEQKRIESSKSKGNALPGHRHHNGLQAKKANAGGKSRRC
jgi:hypothetical protein